MHSPKSAKPDRKRQRRTSGQLIAKSISIKDAKRRSGGCAPKAVELTPGGLSRVAPRRLRRSRGRLTAGQKSAEGIVGQPLQGTATPWRAEVPRRGCRRLADGILAHVRTSGGPTGPAQPVFRRPRSASPGWLPFPALLKPSHGLTLCAALPSRSQRLETRDALGRAFRGILGKRAIANE
jgi:hypothetical protein